MAMQSGFIKRIRDIMRMDAGINGDVLQREEKARRLRRRMGPSLCVYRNIAKLRRTLSSQFFSKNRPSLTFFTQTPDIIRTTFLLFTASLKKVSAHPLRASILSPCSVTAIPAHRKRLPDHNRNRK